MGMPPTYYKKGDWNADCMRCGFSYKASQLRTEWNGLKVCSTCYEPRHPLDLIRIPRTERPLPWTCHPRNNYVTGLDYHEARGVMYADGTFEADGSTPVEETRRYVTFGPVDPDSL